MALSNKELMLLNYFEQHWFVNSSVPTEDYCAEKGGLDRNFYRNCLRKKEFRDALVSRGIHIPGLVENPDKPAFADGLTELQLTVANLMLDLRDTRSRSKKLSDCGVSSGQYQSWLKDPAFSAYLRSRAENILGDNQHEAHLALVGRVQQGDIQAIKYFNELTGYYRPDAQGNVDVPALLQLFVEIIQKHVRDTDTQRAIASDLLALGVTTRAPSPVGSKIIRGEIASGF